MIPTGYQGHCTGARSLICHSPDVLSSQGEITFYSECEFLDELLPPTYRRLNLNQGHVPQTLNEFMNNPLPPLPASLPIHDPDNPQDDATPAARYSHLQNVYKSQLHHYRDFLGKGTVPVPLKNVREYIAHYDLEGQNVYYKYLAVKEARIYCTFDHDDVGQIALVDMPGLGETVVGAERRLVKLWRAYRYCALRDHAYRSCEPT